VRLFTHRRQREVFDGQAFVRGSGGELERVSSFFQFDGYGLGVLPHTARVGQCNIDHRPSVQSEKKTPFRGHRNNIRGKLVFPGCRGLDGVSKQLGPLAGEVVMHLYAVAVDALHEANLFRALGRSTRRHRNGNHAVLADHDRLVGFRHLDLGTVSAAASTLDSASSSPVIATSTTLASSTIASFR